MICSSQIVEEDYTEKTCDINGDWKINKSDVEKLTELITKGWADVKKHDFNGDWSVSISDVMICSSQIVEEENPTKECEWMDKAKVSHSIDNDTVTLKWNAIEWNNVQISIYNPNKRKYIDLWTVKMSAKKFSYKVSWEWEQNFKLSNGCNDYNYKVDIELTTEQKINSEFWTISISNPKNPSEWFTIMDRNLWATKIWAWKNAPKESYWYYYQRWNNYGFPTNWEITKTSEVQVNASKYWPNNPYSNSTFITRKEMPFNWDSSNNNNLWGWLSWRNIQWPCPEWFHIPSIYEWNKVLEYWIQWYNEKNWTSIKLNNPIWVDLKYVWWTDLWTSFSEYFNIPYAGARRFGSATIFATWQWSNLWTSTASSEYLDSAYDLYVYSNSVDTVGAQHRSFWYPIRCFKNTYEPTTEKPKNQTKSCDINGDWKIDKTDAETLANLITKGTANINKHDINNDWTVSITDVTICTSQINNKESTEKSCDINEDWKIDKTDINTLTNLITKWWTDVKKHDFNEDWSVSIADVMICSSKIIEEKSENICDINWDSDVTVSDLSRFNEHCSITKWRDTNKCDLNGDGDVTVSDLSLFQNKCYEEIMWSKIKKGEKENSNPQEETEVSKNWFTKEMNDAYEFAFKNWITTINNIEKTKMYSNLTRIQMAKMLSNYAINIQWKQPDSSKKCQFDDISKELDVKYDEWITKACQLWIMWQNVKRNQFRPNDIVTRAEFTTALSRMLYWIEDGKWNTKYYEPHMAKLYEEWIINKKDPKIEEKRWYVMLMLMRTDGTTEKSCDFNNDWKIDESDINIISDLILNGRDNISKFDINWDGEVSVTDVTICSEKFN